MSDFFNVDISFDEYHLVFPYAIGTLLVVLLVVMGAKRLIAGVVTRSTGEDSAESAGARFRFFDAGFDAKMLLGTLACIVAYAFLLIPLGFVLSSVLFIVAVSLIFRPVFTPRALIGVAAVAVLTPLAIWLVFGVLFDITLP